MHSWCLLHLLDRSPTGKVEVGRKWNIEETHGICTCLVKAAVSFHLRRSFTLSECGTCQELKMLEATGWVQHRWHRVVCVNWIRRKHSYILSKENVVIAEAVRRRGLVEIRTQTLVQIGLGPSSEEQAMVELRPVRQQSGFTSCLQSFPASGSFQMS